MRWHLVGIDKTYIQHEGFEKIPIDNRDIDQRSHGTSGTNHQLEPFSKFKSINNSFNLSHHGKITVYLDRIHQYLCPVKFL